MRLLGLFTNTSKSTKSLVISAETGSQKFDRFFCFTTSGSPEHALGYLFSFIGLSILLGGDYEGGLGWG